MARLAVLSSGNGSNFQAIAERIKQTRHVLACMICDRKKAYSFERADKLGVKGYYVTYAGRTREDAEEEILSILDSEKIDLIALAGFMRILGSAVVDRYEGRLVNIHPALLPKYPGAHGIAESYSSGDSELGITIHYVDRGMDTGPVILQKSFSRGKDEDIEEIEEKIHKLEYEFYPRVIEKLLDSFNT